MAEDKCPVDHSQRASWLQKMKGSQKGTEPQTAVPGPETCPVDHSARADWLKNVTVTTLLKTEAIEVPTALEGCNSDSLGKGYSISDTDLPLDREISTIPRTDTRSNWIYPSQKQFYDAMKRKNWRPEAEDMQTVVPIHNQVNELAWNHILNWERSYVEESKATCGGISLTSFKGDLKKLTPRAWFRLQILGLAKPFDRHDWLVSRCGVDVPYVIDFYGGGESGVVVDARPKFNSWEGFKLRVGRAFGWL